MINLKVFFLFIVLAFIVSCTTKPPTLKEIRFSIEGKVVDDNNYDPLENVNIIINGPGFEFRGETDANGKFLFNEDYSKDFQQQIRTYGREGWKETLSTTVCVIKCNKSNYRSHEEQFLWNKHNYKVSLIEIEKIILDPPDGCGIDSIYSAKLGECVPDCGPKREWDNSKSECVEKEFVGRDDLTTEDRSQIRIQIEAFGCKDLIFDFNENRCNGGNCEYESKERTLTFVSRTGSPIESRLRIVYINPKGVEQVNEFSWDPDFLYEQNEKKGLKIKYDTNKNSLTANWK